MASLTAANATFTLSIFGLYNTPQQLQGFSTDDVFSTDPVDAAETFMGVDGTLSAGFKYVEFKQSVSLQADSASNDIFDNWYAAQQAQADIYFANGTIRLPGLGKMFTMTRGVLSSYPPIPDAGKTLKPRKFGLTWQSIAAAPIGF